MLPDNSFTFGRANSLEDWGIKVIVYDSFSPDKRQRSKKIPFRHGRFDYGKKYYDERIVRLDCQLTKKLTKGEMREVIYWLSKRARLTLWDEQDKYYVGELLDSVDVDVFPNEVARNFVLPILCEPFAYSALNELPITEAQTEVDYQGTAETPTLIILRNRTTEPIRYVTLTLVSRREAQ